MTDTRVSRNAMCNLLNIYHIAEIMHRGRGTKLRKRASLSSVRSGIIQNVLFVVHCYVFSMIYFRYKKW